MRLREWKLMNVNQSTTSQSTTKTTTASSTGTFNFNNRDYKNRFKKLLDYVKARSRAERKEIKKLDNNNFHYSEHHNEKGHEWDTDILVVTSKFTDDWAFQYHIDGEYDSGEQGEGYEDLIRALSFYINIPSVGTAEYSNLLTEWVAAKNNVADDFENYESLWD